MVESRRSTTDEIRARRVLIGRIKHVMQAKAADALKVETWKRTCDYMHPKGAEFCLKCKKTPRTIVEIVEAGRVRAEDETELRCIRTQCYWCGEGNEPERLDFSASWCHVNPLKTQRAVFGFSDPTKHAMRSGPDFKCDAGPLYEMRRNKKR